MRIKAYITLFLVALTIAACSYIAEEDQLIYVKPAPVSRCVLVEDFTGQRCTNCPDAALTVEQLIEQYGGDTIIAVSIHSGPLGFHTNSRYLGLSTDAGDEYYNHWNLEYQPVGIIDRGAPAEHTAWSALVREELQKTAPVEISLDLSCENDTLSCDTLSTAPLLHVHTTVRGVDGDTQGKLQLWVIEDNIIAFQMMSDGTRNTSYNHRHVFRAPINGLWGEDITVNEGLTIEKDHSLTIAQDWNTHNLSIVAFVYNNTGVLQVTKAHLTTNEVEEIN